MKKLISLVLALILVLSAMSGMVFAKSSASQNEQHRLILIHQDDKDGNPMNGVQMSMYYQGMNTPIQIDDRINMLSNEYGYFIYCDNRWSPVSIDIADAIPDWVRPYIMKYNFKYTFNISNQPENSQYIVSVKSTANCNDEYFYADSTSSDEIVVNGNQFTISSDIMRLAFINNSFEITIQDMSSNASTEDPEISIGQSTYQVSYIQTNAAVTEEVPIIGLTSEEYLDRYLLKGTLIDKETGAEIVNNTYPVTQGFIQGDPVRVVLSYSFDAAEYNGHEIVSRVTLYSKSDESELITRANYSTGFVIELPTLKEYPIKTSNHSISYDGAKVKAVETISIQNLEPNELYTIKAKLYNKNTGKIVKLIDGSSEVELDVSFNTNEAPFTFLQYEFKLEDNNYCELVSEIELYYRGVLLASQTEDEGFQLVRFDDVKKTAWYAKAVDYVLNAGYFAGTSQKTFSPNVTMNRAMLVTVIWRMFGQLQDNYNGELPFTDIDKDAYYYNALRWCVDNHIIVGTSDTTFSPNAHVTREMVAAILYRLVKNFDIGAGPEGPSFERELDPSVLDKYTDTNKISSWARDGMIWCVENGLIAGTSKTTLSPKDVATRAQIAMIVMRFDQNIH